MEWLMWLGFGISACILFHAGMLTEHILNERKLARILSLECWEEWNEES